MEELFPILDDDEDIGIYQFNLDPDDELEDMYNRSAPAEAAAGVTLFYRDDEGRASASALIGELAAEGHMESISPFEFAPDVMTYLGLHRLPTYLEDMMSPAQDEWWYRGVYVQVGFWRPELADEESLIRGIAVAMTFYDATVKPYSMHQKIRAEARAFEGQYEDDPTPGVIARNYRLTVGDIFREGVGVWCRDLVMPRNEILVKVRARLANADPQQEWERFKASGMPYYLDLDPVSP
ncbi:MAG TPA: hypothetical protein VGL38_05890 [bacterium]